MDNLNDEPSDVLKQIIDILSMEEHYIMARDSDGNVLDYIDEDARYELRRDYKVAGNQ